MAYIVQADIENAVGGTTGLKRILRSTTVDTSRVTSAIEYAESTIDSYAQGSPGFPWSPIPNAAEQVALAIAIWRLYHLSWPANNIAEAIEHAYGEAIKKLELLQAGQTSWVAGSNPAQQNASKVFVWLPGDTRSSDNPRRSTRSQLDGL